MAKWRLLIDWKVGRIGRYVTTSGIQKQLSWFRCVCRQVSFEITSAEWIFWFNCCSQYCTPVLIDVFKVHRSTSKDGFHLNKFGKGEAFGYKRSLFYNGVGGNYRFGGTDVLTSRSVPIRPSLRETLVSSKMTSSADHEIVNLIVGWWQLRFRMKTHRARLPWAHIAKMSFIYFHRTLRHFVLGLQQLPFELSHEQISVWWCHTDVHFPMAVPWICK